MGPLQRFLARRAGSAANVRHCPPPAPPHPNAGTILGIITTPLPLGAVAMLGLGVSMVTKVLTFPEAFSAFSTEIP